MRVVPYVEDTKNALVMRLEPARSLAEMASLQAAFKEAIQKQFQLESRELACEPCRRRASARRSCSTRPPRAAPACCGRWSRIPTVIPMLARQALEICHFDPDTLEDTGAQHCGKACYECLLDYGNQPDHLFLDRFLIRDVLAQLAKADVQARGRHGSPRRADGGAAARCDSELEKKWLDLLDELMLRPPSHAQYPVEACSTRPGLLLPGTQRGDLRRRPAARQDGADQERTRRSPGA